MAALMLIKQLGGFDRSILEINLAMLDPVPGNLVVTSQVDFMKICLANQTIDLSECHNLTRVLTLYPNIPLPDIAVHAPLLPKYPEKCDVDEDIIPGCHAETQYVMEYANRLQLPDRSFITYMRIMDFMLACGTQYKMPELKISQLSDMGQSKTEALIKCYQREMGRVAENMSRACHSINGTQIITDVSGKPAYLNQHHKKIAGSGESDATKTNDCVFRFSSVVPRRTQDNDDCLSEAIYILFRKFVLNVKNVITTAGMHSHKSEIIVSIMAELDGRKNFTDADEFKNALRNVIAITLVKDRSLSGFFTYSATANEVLTMLRKREFKALANMVMGSCSGMIRASDLCMFVTGSTDDKVFEAGNAGYIYGLFKAGDQPVLTRNNVPAYMRSEVLPVSMSVRYAK